ncbi:sulfite exporter TauE/SafE family protein [Kamptonema cortianum]|nr:sulfite exporter TauE/SafE family protein [Kamptonema cortianum]
MFPFADIPSFLIVSLAIVAVGLTRISFGGGPGVIAVPLLAFVLPPAKAAGVLLPIMIICDMILLKFYLKDARWSLIKLLLPGTLIGILIGTLTFALASESSLRKLLGAICVIFSSSAFSGAESFKLRRE